MPSGPAKTAMIAGGFTVEIVSEGAHTVAATGKLSSAIPGVVTGVMVTAATSTPVGIAAAYVVDYLVTEYISIYEKFKNLTDPDGGVSGKNAMVPGYLGYGVPMPPDVLRTMQEGIRHGDAGVTLTVGNEFNALDLISELIRLGQRSQIPGNRPDSSESGGGTTGGIIRRAGEAIDDILDRGGSATGATGNVTRVGANALAGAVDAGMNIFQKAQDAAAAAYQREYNRDRQDSGGGRPSSDSAADRAADRAAAERASSGGGGPDSGRVGGGGTTSGGAGGGTRPGGGAGGDGRREGWGDSGGGSTERKDGAGRTRGDPGYVGPQPILLDLDGDGVKITEYQNSTQFMTGKDGLQHRSSWTGAGDGVLFYDPDSRNAITEARQYVFTE